MPVTPSSSRSSSPSPERSDAASAAAPAKRGSMEGKRDVSPKKESPETRKVGETGKNALASGGVTFERQRGKGAQPQMSQAEKDASRQARTQFLEKKKLREKSEDTVSVSSEGSDPERASSTAEQVSSDLLGPSPSSPALSSSPSKPLGRSSKSDETVNKVRSRTLISDIEPTTKSEATVAIPLIGGRRNLYREQEVKKEVNQALADFHDFKSKKPTNELAAVQEQDEEEEENEESEVTSTPAAQAAAAPAKPKEALSAPISFGGNRRGSSQMTKAQSDTNREMREKVAAARLARGENPSTVRKPTNTSNLKPISEEDE